MSKNRLASGRIIHAFCSVSDSTRVILLKDVADRGGLGDKEWELLQKKQDNIKKEIATMRKLANIIERRPAA